MVPDGWKFQTLGDAGVKVIDGDRGKEYPKSTDFFDSGYCVFLSAKNVTKRGFLFTDVKFINKEKHLKLRKGVVERGNIVLTTRGTVGQFAHYTDCVPFDVLRINSGMVVLDTNTSACRPDFFFALCHSKIVGKQIDTASFGSAQPQLTVKIILGLKLPIPPLPEQKKIAKILQTWDRAIATTEKLIDASKQQKKALMQQLLTGKKRFAGFEGEWDLITVAEFGRVVTGSTPPRNISSHYGGSFSWATAEDFKKKYVGNTKTKLTPSGVKTVRIVPKGSVLVTCIASIGKNAIAGEDLATNQQINSVVINKENYNEFFYYLICFSNSKLLSWAGTTAVPILNKSSFEKIPLLAPKVEEQRRAAQVLKSADCELDLLWSKLTHLKQEKKALMQQLLTGKRRVKVDE